MDEELCLMGPRQLDELLEFLCEGPGMHLATRSEVADCWRRAAAEYRRLEATEAGAADDPEMRPMPKSLAAHVHALTASASIRATFDTVPVAFVLVPLDKLVVSQYALTRSIVDGILGAHRAPIRPLQAARLCLPLSSAAGAFALRYRDEDEFVFESAGHDMRFLGSRVIEPRRVAGLDLHGRAAAIVALGIGYSTNALNVVRWRNRLVLNNGHHRVYALRALGATHVPCIVQACGSFDEVQQAATSEIVDHSDLYFESPRPPLLRDFDHPLLARRFPMPRLRREVRVRIDVKSRLVAA
jgi:hypothetical protein